MQDNALGAIQLNEKTKNEQELNMAMQELYEVKKKIEELELPKGYTPVSLTKYKTFNLTGKLKDSDGITEKDVYALELEKEDERLTQLYSCRNKELYLLATVNSKNELILSDEEKEKYAALTRSGELDHTFSFDKNEIEEEKEFDISLDDEKDQEEEKKDNEKGEEGRKTKIAKAIGVNPENVLMVVEIKDEVTLSRVLNKNLDTKNLYAVKLRQDSGGVGSNDWIIVNQKSNGNFENAMVQDPSDTMQDISQTVGLKRNNLQAPDLDPGDINSIQKNGTRYVETNINGRRIDDEYAIIETQKDYKATVHAVRGENDKAELVCTDEHSEHDIEKVELPDRELQLEEEKEEEEIIEKTSEEEQEIEDTEEDRTPGGDAYDRRFEHRH